MNSTAVKVYKQTLKKNHEVNSFQIRSSHRIQKYQKHIHNLVALAQYIQPTTLKSRVNHTTTAYENDKYPSLLQETKYDKSETVYLQ